MSRYDNNIVLKTPQGKPYFKSKFYPNIPLSKNDIYIITSAEDRLDSLAYTYYNDSEMWWIIAAANNNKTGASLFPKPGTQLRIPTDLSSVMRLFNNFNKAR